MGRAEKYRIGISGWRYAPWRGKFYPPKLPQRSELEYASRKVNSIEINGSFYSLQSPRLYRSWRETVPSDFVFSVKGGRFITHVKRLRNVEKPLANFFASGVLALEEKLGPFLWQLPPRLKYDRALLESFLRQLPRTFSEAAKLARRHDVVTKGRSFMSPRRRGRLRHALEVRHESFRNPEFLPLLKKYRVAIVVADTAGKWPYFDEVTSDFAYIRLHGDEELYVSGYTPRALRLWARRIRAWGKKVREVYVYFDNDAKVRAPVDAQAMAALLKKSNP